MADEIVNKLGFSVEDALQALRNLDNALQNSGLALRTFGGELDNWNSQAEAAVKRLQEMASAATRTANAMSKAGSLQLPTAPAAAAGTSAGFWLPPGMEADAKRLDTALANVGKTAADTGGKIKSGMKDGADATKDADDKTARLVVTWGTLSRVVMTQFIVRAMSQIRDALRDAVSESIEFQRRVAEVQTIAPEIGGSFAQLTGEAAEFAKQYNVPLKEATEGLYQTLSNQFTSMADRANVMTAAMKLAKVGVMDFHQAILLITGTLNAYGMGTDQADAVAAKFFTTIRLGRVRGEELAGTMGQVMPIAKELGISLDELNAAMVGMTIGGIDAHKSVTALRSAMTAFIKPSEDMKRVTREMGFSDPTQLVAAKGFEGALQAIAAAADNMGVKIAKDIPNVRGLLAEFRLTREGVKQVEEAMKAMEASTPEMLDKVLKQFTSTDSEKLTKTINQLKIDLTQDFGSWLTCILADMMALVGGADKLAAVIQGIGTAAIPAAIALGVLIIAVRGLGLAMGPIGWVFLVASAAISLFAGSMSYSTAQSINETRRLAAEQRQATLDFIKNKQEERRVAEEEEQKKTAAENREWENRAAMMRRSYFKALDELRDRNRDIIESDRQAMQSMISSQERVVAAYRNAANAALRIVQESQNHRVGLEDQYSDLMFRKWMDEDVKFEDSQKARLILQRSWALEAQANEALAKAQTEDDVRRAQAVSQRAEAYLKEGTELAKNTGETWLQDQAQRSIRTNLEQRISAEKKLEQLQAERAQKLADEAANEQKRLDTMKSLMKDILTDLQAFDKHGAKSPQELAKQQADLTEKLGQFREQWMGGKKVEVADLLAFDQLQRRVTTALEGGVSQTEVGKLWAAPETFAKFRADIEQGVGPVRLMVEWINVSSPRLAEATKGMSAEEAINHYSQELQRTKQIIDQFGMMKGQLADDNATLAKVSDEIKGSLDRWANVGWIKDLDRFGGLAKILANQNSLFPGMFQPIRDAIFGLQDAIAKFQTPGAKVSTADLDLLKAAQEKYLEAVRPNAASKEALEEFMRAASRAVDLSKKIEAEQRGLQQMAPKAAEATEDRAVLEEALKAVQKSAEEAKKSTGEVKTNAEGANAALGQVSQINMGGLVNQAQALADAMWDVANASQYIQAPAPAMTAAHGGVAWKFLAGGGPAGTDVIPAMLSPGEVVINAASARRFASQLTAINAGVQPAYRSEGGSVTNIGDINVTVNGGGTGRQTARSIAAELRRELRRGTATL
jgi:TP901 family phage tail tape measure protein